MKKSLGKYTLILKRCFPILWKKCFYCGNFFKFELGWKLTSYLQGEISKVKYVCKRCGGQQRII